MSSGKINLSGEAARSTMGGVATFAGWLALGVLALVTAGHAVSITMAWANLNPAGGDIIAILALIGVALVEVFAVLIAVMYATHVLRAKQKPVAMAIEGLWFLFAAVNLISSFSMKHGGEVPGFVGYWVTFGLPTAGLIVGGLFYVVMRLNPDAGRADDNAELDEEFTNIQHQAEVEVLNSEQMKVVVRQAAWQKLPAVVGRRLGLSEAQIRNLELHAPALIDARGGDPDTLPLPAGYGEEYPTPRRRDDVDLEDLVSYLVEERLRERERTAQPIPAYHNGDGPDADARPTPRPAGR